MFGLIRRNQNAVEKSKAIGGVALGCGYRRRAGRGRIRRGRACHRSLCHRAHGVGAAHIKRLQIDELIGGQADDSRKVGRRQSLRPLRPAFAYNRAIKRWSPLLDEGDGGIRQNFAHRLGRRRFAIDAQQRLGAGAAQQHPCLCSVAAVGVVAEKT